MATVTVRPDATSSQTGAVTGAANAHSALSDNSDSSYLVGYTGVSLAAPSALPSGAVWKEAKVRMRSKKTGATNGRIWTAWGASAVPTTVTPGPFTISWSSFTTTVLGTYTISTAPSTNSGTFTLVDAASTQASELYVDYVYVAKPTLTVENPSGAYADNDQPDVTWTPTFDADGGAQTRYQVKVFSSAQYSAGGFSAATSTATYDSGQVASAAVTQALPEALEDGVYRAYVRVAQTVNGSLHWSDYAFSQFVITALPPATPASITVNPDDLNARIEIDVAVGDGGDPTNLLPNPNFTTDTTGWAVSGADFTGAAISRQTSDWTGHTSGYLRVTGTKDNNATERTLAAITTTGSGGMAVSASTAYAAVVNIRGKDTTATGGYKLRIYWYKSNGNASDVTASVATDTFPVANEEEDTRLLSAVSPSDAAYAAIAVEGITDTASDVVTFYIDDLIFAEQPTSDFVQVQRSVDNGTTWETLRTLRDDGLQPTSSLAATVYDYEVGNGVQALYRAAAVHDYGSGLSAASAYITAAGEEAWTSDSWWLKAPTRPDLNLEVTLNSLSTVERASRTGIFQPLGSSTSIAVADTRGTATGPIALNVDTVEEREALNAILDLRAPLLVQGVPSHYWDDRYVIFGAWQSERAPDKAWVEATIDSSAWSEVEGPIGAIDLDDWPDGGS